MEWWSDGREQRWLHHDSAGAVSREPKARLFLSYGRRDANELADRLRVDLERRGYEVWQDTRRIRPGKEWELEIRDGLRSTQVVVALLSPHAVRRTGGAENPDDLDSVCLDELSFARFSRPPIPIVPAMAVPCEPPFCIFRLDYVDLCAWKDSEERYWAGLERLLQAVELALRGEVRYREWESRLRPWDFAALLNEKRRDFCGREWLFQEIEAWRATCPERALLITGDPGAGKSAVVAELIHRNPGRQVLAYHCCQADTPATLQPALFVRSIAAMIASQLDEYAALLADPVVEAALSEESCARDPASAFESGVLIPLESLHAPEAGARYLLVDALDEALALERGAAPVTIVDLLAARLERLPAWLRVVATTRKERAVLTRLGGLRARELDAQDPRNLEDIDTYITRRLQSPDLAGRLRESGRSAEQVRRELRERSAGNFLYVQQVLQGVERGLYDFGGLGDLPPGLYGLYLRSFQRHFPDGNGYADARAVLQVVAAAGEPLTAEQLARAVGLDPEEELAPVLRRLSAYLPEREGRYAVYHKSFLDWLTDPESRGDWYYISCAQGHERLAELCGAEYRRGPERMSAFALRYFPTHLLGAGQWEELSAVLSDLGFLEAKSAAGMTHGLVADYNTVLAAGLPTERRRAVEEFARFLRAQSHALARNPALTFQQAANEPDATAPAQAARRRQEAGLETRRWLRWINKPQARSACLMTLAGHTDWVTACAFSPEGTRILSASRDRTLKLWDAHTGAELAILKGHTDWVTACAFSPDGTRILSASKDKTLKLWDAHAGTELATLKGHTSKALAYAFAPDGSRILCVTDHSAPAEPARWDDKQQRRIPSPSRRRLKLWDAHTGAELATLNGHLDRVESCAFSPDGTRFLSASEVWSRDCFLSASLKLWDAHTGAELVTLQGHTRSVEACAVSPDGTHLLSVSSDGTVKLWDAHTGAEVATLDVAGFQGHTNWVEACALSPDSTRVLSASRDNTLKLWDTRAAVELATPPTHTDSVSACALASYGILTASDDELLKLWDAHTLVELASLKEQSSHWVRACALSPDGTRLLSAADVKDTTLKLRDAQTGVELATLKGHTGPVTACTFSPDGTRLLSASFDETLKLWDAHNAGELVALEGHTRIVTNCTFSPDGTRILSASYDRTLKLWDAHTGVELATLLGHSDRVKACAFSPDGTRIVSRSYDHTLKLWDAHTGAELATLQGHTDWVSACAFSPDGTRLLSASGDGTLKLWDAHTGEHRLDFLLGDTVRAVAWSRDGLRVAAGTSERVQLFFLENAPAGPPVVTAWQRQPARRMFWERPGTSTRAFRCLLCQRWSEVTAPVLGTELRCPHCGERVRLNPFTIDADWRPLAAAWAGRVPRHP